MVVAPLSHSRGTVEADVVEDDLVGRGLDNRCDDFAVCNPWQVDGLENQC